MFTNLLQAIFRSPRALSSAHTVDYNKTSAALLNNLEFEKQHFLKISFLKKKIHQARAK